MSTLSRTNSHSKKPQYKDYVSFLDGYRGSKRDDQNSVVTSDSGVNFSLNSSLNNSSNSVFSDVSEGSTKNGFRGHVESFNNKNSALPPKAKQTVKTEMFIEIKNPPTPPSYPTKVFEVHRVDSPHESTISVSSAAKIFEKKDQIDSRSHGQLKPKQNSFKKNSIGELSQKFDNISSPAKRPPARRAASIGEVSKIFENKNSPQQINTLHKPKNFNAVPKPFHAAGLPKLNTDVKTTTTTTKPAILSPKPVFTAPAFPKFIPEPPRSYADSVDSALSSLSISPSPPQCVSPPPGGLLSPPPPPPPMPSANFASKSAIQKPSAQKHLNGQASQQIIVHTHQANESTTPNGTLDRNDPRVKKAVYGALRNMYGTYHDQANDYLATLPKNRVKKNNGLDSIINSIASQGGLDKLSGRANPKTDAE